MDTFTQDVTNYLRKLPKGTQRLIGELYGGLEIETNMNRVASDFTLSAEQKVLLQNAVHATLLGVVAFSDFEVYVKNTDIPEEALRSIETSAVLPFLEVLEANNYGITEEEAVKTRPSEDVFAQKLGGTMNQSREEIKIDHSSTPPSAPDRYRSGDPYREAFEDTNQPPTSNL